MPIESEFTLALPHWIDDAVADVPEFLPSPEERMGLVNALADENWRRGNGGPFAAIVVERESGRLVSVGVNVVLASGISSAHAEGMALGLAQKAVGSWDLGGSGLPEHELVVNWRPCIQCYGSAMWSGITSLFVAGSGPELEEISTFDEGPLTADWAEEFESRGITVTQNVLRDEALAVFRAYREAVDAGGVLVYNARGQSDEG